MKVQGYYTKKKYINIYLYLFLEHNYINQLYNQLYNQLKAKKKTWMEFQKKEVIKYQLWPKAHGLRAKKKKKKWSN